MDKRAQYLIQVFEKIGAPLVSAVASAVPEDQGQGSAQKIAELLTRTVKLGIDISNMADLANTGGDSVRVALSGVAGSIVAESFKSSKKTPTDSDLARITQALQAVLTFSENFTPDAENAERLKALSAEGAGLDAHQMHLQYINAFVPVISAVGAFAFGQPEQKLIMEISARLSAGSEKIRKTMAGELTDIDAKRADLAVLRTLAGLYAACHQAETQRGAAGGAPSLERVWQDFDLRVGMLEALARGLVGAGQSASVPASSGGGISPAKPASVQIQSKVEMGKSPDQQAVSNPMQMFAAKPKEGGANDAPPASSGSPMSFFTKKKEE